MNMCGVHNPNIRLRTDRFDSSIVLKSLRGHLSCARKNSHLASKLKNRRKNESSLRSLHQFYLIVNFVVMVACLRRQVVHDVVFHHNQM